MSKFIFFLPGAQIEPRTDAIYSLLCKEIECCSIHLDLRHAPTLTPRLLIATIYFQIDTSEFTGFKFTTRKPTQKTEEQNCSFGSIEAGSLHFESERSITSFNLNLTYISNCKKSLKNSHTALKFYVQVNSTKFVPKTKQ